MRWRPRSPPEHAASGSEAYHRIIGRVSRALGAREAKAPASNIDTLPTLLEIKAMLIAVRLASPCRALILDEPDWGLTRACSVAIVSAAVSEAHRLGVPVLLISHKPWWEPVAASVLKTERDGADAGGTFRIRLRHQHRGAA